MKCIRNVVQVFFLVGLCASSVQLWGAQSIEFVEQDSSEVYAAGVSPLQFSRMVEATKKAMIWLLNHVANIDGAVAAGRELDRGSSQSQDPVHLQQCNSLLWQLLDTAAGYALQARDFALHKRLRVLASAYEIYVMRETYALYSSGNNYEEIASHVFLMAVNTFAVYDLYLTTQDIVAYLQERYKSGELQD